MEIKPKSPEMSVEGISIVMLGDFNPRIFHPMWFAYNGILREAEAREANIDLIHADVSSFTTEWLTIQVVRDRFTAEVKADVYRFHLGDLVRNVFSLLSHSPIRQMGINTGFRLHFKSDKDWHAFGDMLLPKPPWSAVLDKPGLRGLHIQGARNDNHRGLVMISVEPDIHQPGDVIIRCNDHFEKPPVEANEPDESFGAKWAIEILNDDFDASYHHAKERISRLIKNFTTDYTFALEKNLV
jgi:hypothetical protein